jgi:hypothetical protein
VVVLLGVLLQHFPRQLALRPRDIKRVIQKTTAGDELVDAIDNRL